LTEDIDEVHFETLSTSFNQGWAFGNNYDSSPIEIESKQKTGPKSLGKLDKNAIV
jgi:hypothetical protein